MHALRKRRERWEYENQQQLERTFELSLKLVIQTADHASKLTNLSVYLLYKAGRWIGGFGSSLMVALWIGNPEVDKRLADAEQQRRRLSCSPSLWLK